MAHLVVGYPTLAESLRTAELYIESGVQVLELQIPFSHPTADGPVITAACRAAVRQGVTVEDCIEAIRTLRQRYPAQEIVVMSYLNRIYVFGLQRFVKEMENLGVRHLIVPDLPVAVSGTAAVPAGPVQLVPVLAANVTDQRLDQLLDAGFDFFYLMSDFKITGSTFSLHPRLRQIVARIRSQPGGVIGEEREGDTFGPRVGIGFGIATPVQARLASEEADLAIIGSALIRAQEEGRLEIFLEELKNAFATTTGCS